MKIVIVSTYPKQGSMNVGDKLIESATVETIVRLDAAARIDVVWRGEHWGSVRRTILSADHVVFACLAIRKNLNSLYPFLPELLECGVPWSILSAGTSLPISPRGGFEFDVSRSDITLLARLNDGARVFTTRGVLTQAFCRYHGLDRAQFSGDVAFQDQRFEERTFRCVPDVERVLVSDPHYAADYLPSFRRLVSILKDQFTNATVECVVHGKNPMVEQACEQLGVVAHRIFEEPTRGLEVYDACDMHVGFRVHGHVSALKRRKPSYLLEQDGRGSDYGLTIDRRISLTVHPAMRHEFRRRLSLMQSVLPKARPNTSWLETLVAMMTRDREREFSNFCGLEESIEAFNACTREALSAAVGSR